MGNFLEGVVLGEVTDLDWKMALLMGQIQSAKVGELVTLTEQQRS